MVAISTFLTSAVVAVGLIQGTVATFVVTGAPTGGVQPRFEIRELQANHAPMWNLFLQALEAMEHQSQGPESSFYEIAGIHGAPWKSWDGVGHSGSGWDGYCPHGSTLFGPWHRPYLALFEQRISHFAHQIANKFPAGPKRKMYQAAARDLRLPYWDWAKDGQRILPQSLMQKKIQVTRPSGHKAHITNPLSHYHFHPLNDPNVSSSPNTRRSGNAVQAFQNGHAGTKQAVYRFFARGGNYQGVSNAAPGAAGNNIENIHNGIHTTVGGNMASPSQAAFDPIFWLHHANVDRMLALWQHLYPGTYVEPAKQPGTWTIPRDSTQGADSPLTPFHRNKQGQFWTSNSARQTKAFGYTYPELKGNPSKAALRRRINQLYGSAAGVSANVKKTAKRDLFETLTTVTDVNVTLSIAPGELVYEYSADIGMPQSLNDKGYGVYIFLGEVTEEDPSTWLLDANLVGTQVSMGNLAGWENPPIVHSDVVLTQAIVQKYNDGELESLDKDTVTEYLNENLYWRAEQDGQVLHPDDIPEIDVQLISTSVEAPTSDEEFPNFVEHTRLMSVNATIPGV